MINVHKEWYKNKRIHSYSMETMGHNGGGIMPLQKAESEKESAGTPPDFRNDGIAVWVNQTKDGEDYLSVQILGKNGIKVNAFKPKPKQ